MDTQVSPSGAVLFIFFSIIYLVLFLIVQFKIFNRRSKKAEHFCEQAEQDGRMVIAKLDKYREIPKRYSYNGRREYIGEYFYAAPNGKQYKMKFRDCENFISVPPETRTLYLEKGNYRKYYIKDSLDMGKHGTVLTLLSWVIGIIVYLVLSFLEPPALPVVFFCKN